LAVEARVSLPRIWLFYYFVVSDRYRVHHRSWKYFSIPDLTINMVARSLVWSLISMFNRANLRRLAGIFTAAGELALWEFYGLCIAQSFGGFSSFQFHLYLLNLNYVLWLHTVGTCWQQVAMVVVIPQTVALSAEYGICRVIRDAPKKIAKSIRAGKTTVMTRYCGWPSNGSMALSRANHGLFSLTTLRTYFITSKDNL
jgi:hypothetical protein